MRDPKDTACFLHLASKRCSTLVEEQDVPEPWIGIWLCQVSNHIFLTCFHCNENGSTSCDAIASSVSAALRTTTAEFRKIENDVGPRKLCAEF